LLPISWRRNSTISRRAARHRSPSSVAITNRLKASSKASLGYF
jgi:hypothetical protein